MGYGHEVCCSYFFIIFITITKFIYVCIMLATFGGSDTTSATLTKSHFSAFISKYVPSTNSWINLTVSGAVLYASLFYNFVIFFLTQLLQPHYLYRFFRCSRKTISDNCQNYPIYNTILH
jgi:hypothetical protein